MRGGALEKLFLWPYLNPLSHMTTLVRRKDITCQDAPSFSKLSAWMLFTLQARNMTG
jgi:hypothetical protein